MAAVEAYCVKCKEKREMKDPEAITMKNGRPAMQGSCPVCGTKLFRMLSGAASGGDGAEKAMPEGARTKAKKTASQ
jgi:hypothetical protein